LTIALAGLAALVASSPLALGAMEASIGQAKIRFNVVISLRMDILRNLLIKTR